jgi:hypothetical protein
MLVNSIQFLNILAYGFVVSQPIFYLLAMSDTQKNMRPSSYIELRNLLHKNLNFSLRIVYFTTLFSSICWFFCAISVHSSFLIITATLALVTFIIDIFYLFTGDMPINKIIQTWTPENYPANWETYRKKWFRYYHRRQIAGLTGFVSLLLGAVFG